MAINDCKDCPYNYKEGADRWPRCHFVEICGEPSWLNIPPCEDE